MCAAEQPVHATRSASLLVTCCLVTLALGSIHAFSVLIEPLEYRHSLDRGLVSLVYSVALVCLTVAVLAGWRLYPRIAPPRLALASCLLGAAGVAVCALSSSYYALLVGYGLLFGAANGLGYGYVLQLSARITPSRPATAMALITAAYALGATGFAFLLTHWELRHGLAGALLRQAGMIALAGMVAAILLSAWRIRFGEVEAAGRLSTQARGSVRRFRLAYGTNVFAGLMAIGHAAGIVAVAGGDRELGALGVILLSFGNAAGGIAVALAGDRVGPFRLLLGLPLLTLLALLALAMTAHPVSALAGLGIAGFAYGATIAVYPAAIHHAYGAAGPAVYGRVFLAWGVAGLAGPWLAGTLFSVSGSYRLPLLVAAALALVSALLVTGLPLERRPARRTA